ncbi:PTS sugar transporter subunit IIA [Streptomyces albidoflavus]
MTEVMSPLSGQAIGLASVPHPASGSWWGPVPRSTRCASPRRPVSPVAGVVVSLHPHAFVVVDEAGRGVLTHLGIDTVQLNGEGFELLVRKGDTVAQGQSVVRWDPSAVESAGKSPVCPVVALEAVADQLSGVREEGDVAAGQPLFSWN